MTEPTSRRTWAIAAFSWSLSAAFIDVSFSLLPVPIDSDTASAVARFVLVDFALFGVIFFVCTLVTTAIPRPWLGTSRLAVAASFATFVAGLLILASPYDRLTSYFDCRPEVLVCRPYAATFFAPIVVGAVLLFLLGGAMTTRDRNGHSTMLSAIVAAPLLFGLATIAVWYVTYSKPATRVEQLTVMASVILGAGLAVSIARAVTRGNRERTLLVVVFVMLAGFAAIPLAGRSPAVKAVVHHDPIRQSPGAPKTVILITIDALRADGLSCYGQAGAVSPRIDAIATAGVVFENAMSPAPWTVPSVPSLLTGLDPWTLQIGTATMLPVTVPTLAQRMADAGYHTAAIVTNAHLGVDSGLARGFDEYRLITTEMPVENGSAGIRVLQHFLLPPPPRFPDDKADASTLTDAALTTLRAHADGPLFLWLHYLDTHAPYAPPAAYLPRGVTPAAPEGRFDGGAARTPSDFARARDLYEREVRYVDYNVGRIVDELKHLNLYESTAIVVSADHGDQRWEHGQFGHGPELYGEVLRVPLIIKSPLAAARRVTATVSSQSLMATILDLAHAPYAVADLQSPSLIDWISGGSMQAAPIFSATGAPWEPKRSVLFDGLKYIESESTGRQELFDLTKDPGETMSIALVAPDRVATARRLLAERMAAANAMRARRHITTTLRPLDRDTIRRLKALGYVQ